ncbi:MAG: Rrf2 family transcriptional regulator [Clostridia bacterium]|nr:Rrf2 family transcriptional regulator [Clostridia bacterium]
MMISSRGRHALSVMLDLAEHSGEGSIPLKDIAARHGISEKYLESIVAILSKAGFVSGVRGKGGGYTLTKDPKMYTVGSILKLTELSLSPVSCVGDKANVCDHAAKCITLPMWERLDQMIDNYLESITICDLLNREYDCCEN